MLVRLSVDLGTTHTVAVVRRADQQPRALLFDGSPVLPSAVFVDSAGTVHTGRDAQRLGAMQPHGFEPHPKRRIDDGLVLLGAAEVPVVDLLAAILRRVVGEARQAGVEPVGATALTCPADWGQPRRELLRSAARSAGLGEVLLIEEPVAAATYCVDVLGQQVPVGGALAVFDFGGGTLDVAVVRREPAGWRVLGTGGLDDLGGLDIDHALVRHLGQLVAVRDPDVWRRLSSPESTGELRDRQAFLTEVRAAKEMLSRTSSAPVAVPGRDEPLHLTRDELEAVAGPMVARAVDETRRVLERTGAQAAGLLLVGGTSRMPLVGSRLHARLGVAPAVPEQPELPVAHGGLLVGSPSGPVPPAPASSGPYRPVMGGAPAGGTFVPQVSVSAPPGSPAPAGAGGFVPPPPPPPGSYPQVVAPGGPRRAGKRRRRGRRLVSTVVSFAIVGGLLTGGWYGVRWLGSKAANLGGIVGGADPAAAGSTREMTIRKDLALPASEQPVAVAASADRAFAASVGTAKTELFAFDLTGKQVWAASVPAEAAEARLTVVGELLLLDLERSPQAGGDTYRAVLGVADGKVRWQKKWEDRADILYLGTDAIVAATLFRESILERVDLKTGNKKWTRKRTENVATFADRWSGPVLSWPTGAPGPAVVPLLEGRLRDDLTAAANVVELDEGDGKVYLIDGGTGRVLGSGAVPVDYEHWLAYQGLVIGLLEDSPGQDVVVAHQLSGFKQAWRFALPAGATLERLKACGPELVCLSVDGSKSDSVVAVNVRTGQQAWTFSDETADDPGWYVAAGRLVLGDGTFTQVGNAQAVGVDGKVVWGGKDRGADTAVAVAGDRMLLQTTRSNGTKTEFRLALAETATGKVLGAVTVGTEVPDAFAHHGDLVVAVTEDRHVKVATL